MKILSRKYAAKCCPYHMTPSWNRIQETVWKQCVESTQLNAVSTQRHHPEVEEKRRCANNVQKVIFLQMKYLVNAWMLTLPMLRLLLSEAQGCKDFWKPSKTCHVGIRQKALTEYSQMSTHMPGLQPFFQVFFASFCIGQISHQQHKS